VNVDFVTAENGAPSRSSFKESGQREQRGVESEAARARRVDRQEREFGLKSRQRCLRWEPRAERRDKDCGNDQADDTLRQNPPQPDGIVSPPSLAEQRNEGDPRND